MVAVASCFAQMLTLIDRLGFARAVHQHAAERAAQGFGCGDHFVAMLFCQMGSAPSLRACSYIISVGSTKPSLNDR